MVEMVNDYKNMMIHPSPLSFWYILNSGENGKEELFPMKDLISRFRANIITNGTRAFEEEKWDGISVGSLHFQVSSRSSVIFL